MEALRFQVVGEAFKKKPLDVKAPSERPYEYFGKKVFNREKMYKYLPKDVYEKMVDVIDNGSRLDRTVADAVAAGMKQWAVENGVTHYTHWFQPLTEGTAEKHDSFIEWQAARSAGARCFFIPFRWYPFYLRGTWLFSLGSYISCVHYR